MACISVDPPWSRDPHLLIRGSPQPNGGQAPFSTPSFQMSALLEVKDLAYAKGNGQPVISGINFSVNEGDVVVVRGVSGAG